MKFISSRLVNGHIDQIFVSMKERGRVLNAPHVRFFHPKSVFLLQNLKFVEDLEIEGNFLRRSVNDITSLLDINFGSLGRPARGGRGRGGRGGVASRSEKVKPIVERVCGSSQVKKRIECLRVLILKHQ